MAPINFGEHPSCIEVCIRHHAGDCRRPVIIGLPGYGSGLFNLKEGLLGFSPLRSAPFIGIEPFPVRSVSGVKSAVHLEHLQITFALATRAIREAIVQARTLYPDSKVYVVGMSFGALAISSHLNLEPQDASLADGYVPIQGGSFYQTFTNAHYQAMMDDPGFIGHSAWTNKTAFPEQRPLPNERAQLVHAVVNPGDEVTHGQEEVWRGCQMTSIRGARVGSIPSHLVAPVFHTPQIRRVLVAMAR
ncbi:hypothetical protein AUK40_05325 [Candidatus Wirthbacteria bacterium CG2_30_54_11]|uniref:Uncharacterized protein n=1 Tax=Candidatus Wirthbacteria bacterium CG2_30_54_11 TaxID=1817892 RepID=A0A1J5IXX5_9BACT|nr:MAG: hypothetical protein AUK40_05325 [Candidatus Wirthbacteria bacterium CG2_30_54_11]